MHFPEENHCGRRDILKPGQRLRIAVKHKPPLFSKRASDFSLGLPAPRTESFVAMSLCPVA